MFLRHCIKTRPFNPTGYMSASVPGLGTVVCTHLTVSEFPVSIDYDLPFANTTLQTWQRFKP